MTMHNVRLISHTWVFWVTGVLNNRCVIYTSDLGLESILGKRCTEAACMNYDLVYLANREHWAEISCI